MIKVDVTDDVGTLTLDRPQKLNALTDDMLVAFRGAVDRLTKASISVIVVRSSGRHFSAGADLEEWAAPTSAEADAMSRRGEEAFAALAATAMPSVAVIDGVAAGGGLELALACDLRIASTDAKLGLPETSLANLPAYGGVPRLVEVVGSTRAMELLFTGELVSGTRAAEIGLVNWAVDGELLEDKANEVVAMITRADTLSNSLAKSLIGNTPIDGLLARVTSQTEASRQRKQAFLDARAAKKNERQKS